MKFWQKKPTTVNNIVKWLDSIFQKMGFILSDHEIEGTNIKTWEIMYDQIPFFIRIDEIESDIIFFELRSMLCEIPRQNILPFYRKCLELNYDLFGGTIILAETKVCYVQKRQIGYITEEELLGMVGNHLYAATELLSNLSGEFDILKIND